MAEARALVGFCPGGLVVLWRSSVRVGARAGQPVHCSKLAHGAVVPITWPAGPFVPVGLSEPVRSYVRSVRDSAGSGFRVKLGHQPGTPLPAAKLAAVRPG